MLKINYLKFECGLKGMEALNKKMTSVEAATAAVAFLEDCWLTNAGYGSNLTSDGNVECDASIMNGTTLNWGAIGSLRGFKNPIQVAKTVLDAQDVKLPLGLVPPNVLVGEGAKIWAEEKGCITSCNLITG